MYTSDFGFREKPFDVTPDPRFFYTGPSYQEAYTRLLSGIRANVEMPPQFVKCGWVITTRGGDRQK